MEKVEFTFTLSTENRTESKTIAIVELTYGFYLP